MAGHDAPPGLRVPRRFLVKHHDRFLQSDLNKKEGKKSCYIHTFSCTSSWCYTYLYLGEGWKCTLLCGTYGAEYEMGKFYFYFALGNGQSPLRASMAGGASLGNTDQNNGQGISNAHKNTWTWCGDPGSALSFSLSLSFQKATLCSKII